MAASKTKTGWYRGWRKTVVRLLILIVAAGTIFAIGMKNYAWRPLGLSWGQVTTEPAAAAKAAQEAVGSDAATALGSVGERVGRSLENAAGAGDTLIDKAAGVVDSVRVEPVAPKAPEPAAEPEPSGPTEEDREALDKLLKDKGI